MEPSVTPASLKLYTPHDNSSSRQHPMSSDELMNQATAPTTPSYGHPHQDDAFPQNDNGDQFEDDEDDLSSGDDHSAELEEEMTEEDLDEHKHQMNGMSHSFSGVAGEVQPFMGGGFHPSLDQHRMIGTEGHSLENEREMNSHHGDLLSGEAAGGTTEDDEGDEIVDDDEDRSQDEHVQYDERHSHHARSHQDVPTLDTRELEYSEIDIGEVRDSSRIDIEDEEELGHSIEGEEVEEEEEERTDESEEEEDVDGDVTERTYEEGEEELTEGVDDEGTEGEELDSEEEDELDDDEELEVDEDDGSDEMSDGVGYEVDDGGDIDGDIVEESDAEEYRRERTHSDDDVDHGDNVVHDDENGDDQNDNETTTENGDEGDEDIEELEEVNTTDASLGGYVHPAVAVATSSEGVTTSATTALAVASGLSGVALAAAAPMIARTAGIQYGIQNGIQQQQTQQYSQLATSPPASTFIHQSSANTTTLGGFIHHHQIGIASPAATTSMMTQHKSPTITPSAIPVTMTQHTFSRMPQATTTVYPQTKESPLGHLAMNQTGSSTVSYQQYSQNNQNSISAGKVFTSQQQQQITSSSSPQTFISAPTFNNLQQQQPSHNNATSLSVEKQQHAMTISTGVSGMSQPVSRSYTSHHQQQSTAPFNGALTTAMSPTNTQASTTRAVHNSNYNSAPIRRFVTAPQSSNTNIQSSVKTSSNAHVPLNHPSISDTAVTTTSAAANAMGIRAFTDRSPSTTTQNVHRFATAQSPVSTLNTQQQQQQQQQQLGQNRVFQGIPLHSTINTTAAGVQVSGSNVTRHITSTPQVTETISTHSPLPPTVGYHNQAATHIHQHQQQQQLQQQHTTSVSPAMQPISHHTTSTTVAPSTKIQGASTTTSTVGSAATPWYATSPSSHATFQGVARPPIVNGVASETRTPASHHQPITVQTPMGINAGNMGINVGINGGPHRFQTTQSVMTTATSPAVSKPIHSLDNKALNVHAVSNQSESMKIQARGNQQHRHNVHRFTTAATATNTPAHAPSPMLTPSYRSTIGSLAAPAWIPSQHASSAVQPWYMQSVSEQLRQSRTLNGATASRTASTQSVSGATTITQAVIRPAPIAVGGSPSSFWAQQQNQNREGSSSEQKKHRRHKHHHHRHHKKHHKSSTERQNNKGASSPETQSIKSSYGRQSPSAAQGGWSFQSFFRNLVGGA